MEVYFSNRPPHCSPHVHVIKHHSYLSQCICHIDYKTLKHLSLLRQDLRLAVLPNNVYQLSWRKQNVLVVRRKWSAMYSAPCHNAVFVLGTFSSILAARVKCHIMLLHISMHLCTFVCCIGIVLNVGVHQCTIYLAPVLCKPCTCIIT